MGSTDKPADLETTKEVPPPPKGEAYGSTPPPPKRDYFFVVDVILRFLVFAAALTSVLVIVISKQTVHLGPRITVAKFNHSPAFMWVIYMHPKCFLSFC